MFVKGFGEPGALSSPYPVSQTVLYSTKHLSDTHCALGIVLGRKGWVRQLLFPSTSQLDVYAQTQISICRGAKSGVRDVRGKGRGNSFYPVQKSGSFLKAPANCVCYFSLSDSAYIFVPETVFHLGVEVTLNQREWRLGVSFPMMARFRFLNKRRVLFEGNNSSNGG